MCDYNKPYPFYDDDTEDEEKDDVLSYLESKRKQEEKDAAELVDKMIIYSSIKDMFRGK